MKTENTGIQSTNTVLGSLPVGARIHSAKGHRTSNGHHMDLSYTVGSTSYRTTIVTTGGQSA